MSDTLSTEVARQALAAAQDPRRDVADRIGMLVEVAVGMLTRPRDVSELVEATTLYERALELAAGDALTVARVQVGLAAALQAIPEEGTAALERARGALLDALPVLRQDGGDEEVADAEMRLGLACQGLAPFHKAPLRDAIQAYQRALRFYDRDAWPREFAILHNNLATAYLSLPLSDEHAKMREALAAQSFERALEVVTFEGDPVEYAMLQNNLGNALQYLPSGHRFANIARAVEAYDEALRVRTERAMPVEHANTLANKANALANLPDDPDDLSKGNPANLATARALYADAMRIFSDHGLPERAAIVATALAELDAEASASNGASPAPAS